MLEIKFAIHVEYYLHPTKESFKFILNYSEANKDHKVFVIGGY